MVARHVLRPTRIFYDHSISLTIIRHCKRPLILNRWGCWPRGEGGERWRVAMPRGREGSGGVEVVARIYNCGSNNGWKGSTRWHVNQCLRILKLLIAFQREQSCISRTSHENKNGAYGRLYVATVARIASLYASHSSSRGIIPHVAILVWTSQQFPRLWQNWCWRLNNHCCWWRIRTTTT